MTPENQPIRLPNDVWGQGFGNNPIARPQMESLSPSDATACSPSSNTPETDALWEAWEDEKLPNGQFRYGPKDLADHARDLERRLNAIYETTRSAICILDGNEDVIDWRDRNQPELLRKLCEHLEAR